MRGLDSVTVCLPLKAHTVSIMHFLWGLEWNEQRTNGWTRHIPSVCNTCGNQCLRIPIFLWEIGKKGTNKEAVHLRILVHKHCSASFFFLHKSILCIFNKFIYKRLPAVVLDTHTERPLLNIGGWILTSVIQMDKWPRSCRYRKPWRQSKLFPVLKMIPHLYFHV